MKKHYIQIEKNITFFVKRESVRKIEKIISREIIGRYYNIIQHDHMNCYWTDYKTTSDFLPDYGTNSQII